MVRITKKVMYQSIIIEDLLDIYSISLAFPNLINSGILKKIIPKMITFQLNMTHSNGGFSISMIALLQVL